MRFDDNPLDVLVGGSAKLWMLLVGVNQYQDQQLAPLSFAVSDCQGLADALAKATQSFPDREVIIHCDAAAPTSTREAIRTSLQKIVDQAGSQDTVLFYFSGHGMVEPASKQPFLCLTETQTDNLQNTGLGLQELLQQLRDCGASKQLVMLDACHSGSIGHLWGRARGEARQTQSDPTRELKEVLRRRADESGGFCALLSCDEGQRSWEFPDLEHGVFTYYLMQGLQGEATDERGMIEAKNLYNYVYTQTQQFIDSRMRQLRPPEPHNYQQTPRLIISAAGNLVLGFRPEANDAVASIEKRVTAPLEAHQRNLQQYKKVFTRAVHWQYPLSHDDQEFLANLRRVLDLSQETTRLIERQITQGYEQKLQEYEETFTKAIHQQYPLSYETRRQLQQLQQSLDLRQEIIDPVETRITQVYEQKLQQYEAAFARAIRHQYSLSDSDRKFLANLQQLNLTENQIDRGYEQKLQQYEAAFTKAIHQQYPLGEEAYQPLQLLQHNLGLGNEITESIEARVTQAYEQKLQQYETAFTKAAQRQYPLKHDDCEFLTSLRRSLDLNQKITDSIEELEYLQRGLNLSEKNTDLIEQKVTETYNLNPTPTVDPLGVNPQQAEKHQKKVRPLLPKAIVVVAVVGVSVSAYYAYSLWQADKSAKAALERTQTLKAARNYDACLNQAAMIPQQSRFYTDAQNLLSQCQRLVRDQQWLSQAKVFAAKNNLKDAIAQANGIRSDSSFHPEAQRLISQWSETLLKQAEAQYTQSDDSKDLESAINITKAIPLTTSVAQKVEATITKWRTEWNKNETYLEGAQAALNQGQWGEAIEKANQVKLLGQEVKQETPYWQNKIKPIVARAGELRAASITQAETTQQSSTQQPTTQRSTTQQSSTRQSVSQPSSTRQSSTRQPTTQRSKTRQSAIRQPFPQRSTTQRSRSGNWPADIR